MVSPVHIRFWGSDDQPEKKGAQQGVPNTVYGIKEPEIHTPKEVGYGAAHVYVKFYIVQFVSRMSPSSLQQGIEL